MKKHLFLALLSCSLVTSCSSLPNRPPEFSAIENESLCSREPAEAGLRCAAVHNSDVVADLLSDKKGKIKADEVLKNAWSTQKYNEAFRQTESDGLWSALIGSEGLAEAKSRGQHPIETMTEKVALNWTKTKRFMDAIPVGKLQLSRSLLSSINRQIMTETTDQASHFIDGSPQRAPLVKFRQYLRDVSSYFVRLSGSYRKRASYQSFLLKPLSEEQYNSIQLNKEALGIDFLEAPWSASGARRGLVRSVKAGEVTERTDAVLTWANEQMQKVKNGDKDALSGIEIAAEVHWKLAAIQPFAYGSGRTIQILTNRLLNEMGLPPSTRIQVDMGNLPSRQQMVELYRNGVNDYLALLRGGNNKEVATIYGRGIGTRFTPESYQEYAHVSDLIRTRETGITPKNTSDAFEMGREGKPFIIADDGFFYDQNGIPYISRRTDSGLKLYPIADKNYILYGQSGEANHSQGTKRAPSPALKETFGNNMALAEGILQGQIKPEAIEVLNYDQVLKANNEGDFQFYSWQTPLLERVVRISEDPITDPYYVLAQTRGDPISEAKAGRTDFEQAFFRNTAQTRPSDVIGQYELKDIEYIKLGLAIKASKTIAPEKKDSLLRELETSREKIHRAARQILKPYFDAIAHLSEGDRAYLETHPEFIGVETFLKYSKLRYDDFQTARAKLGDKDVYVMRATSGRLVKWLGFRSEANMRELFDWVPFDKKIVSFLKVIQGDISRAPRTTSETSEFGRVLPRNIRAKIAAFVGNDSRLRGVLTSLATRLFVSEYQFRKTDQEMEREFVTEYLHTGASRGGKKGLSTTVSPQLLFKASKATEPTDVTADTTNSPVVKFSRQGDAQIYFLRLPLKDVDVGYSSLWRDQYEVYLKRGYGTIRSHFITQEKISGTALLDGPVGEPTERAQSVVSILGSIPTGLTKEKKK
ncbi:MAG: hypothetical protein COT73_10750 [Bdellovibrio sp. CG10_big_fil_rev_8_21_14_0_10_47_8]|nr:MAG: hypothetical protein COT73_10750 [Bdellovibrio sp. CG10_big_fil_rev_8_21_14_0_10_47_8]